jgi:threonine/homoserine/homoserine lactone efflux protein
VSYLHYYAEAMSFLSVFTLYLVRLAPAAILGVSIVLVVRRSATLGIQNSAAVPVGIVLGYIIFVSLPILGVAVLAD